MTVIEMVAALQVELSRGKQNIETRIRSIPDGWRRYCLASSLMDKLLEQIYDTMTVTQLRHMDNLCRYGKMQICADKTLPVTAAAVVSGEVLETLITYSMDGECALCVKEGGEIKQCKLREALLEICPPEDFDKFGCEYARIESDVIRERLEKQRKGSDEK